MNENPFEMEEEEEESGGGGEGWLATYGDMVTLLLCFFVLLFSMSSIQESKFKQLAESLKSSLGVQNVPEAGTREGLDIVDRETEDQHNEVAVDELGGYVQKIDQQTLNQIQEFIMYNELQGKVKVEGQENGATITISDVVIFSSGEADISAGGMDIIEKLKDILAQFNYNIRVKGHTDNIPIHDEIFQSNWELSAVRACRIVRYFEESGIDPRKMSAQGFGEYQPIASNESPEGRAINRRVEIVYERAEGEAKTDTTRNVYYKD